MALVLADRVRETTTTAGTGTITLLGAVPSCQSFAVVGNGNTTYYTIVAQSGTEWEVGIGTYTSSGTTLSRTTVLSSSNGGSLVNFTAGTKDVFVDYPASKAVYEDASGNVDGYPITGGTINNTTIGATTPSTGVFTTLTATGQTSLGGVAGSDVFRVLRDNTFAGTTVASFTAPQFSFIPPQSSFGAAVIGLGLNPRINSFGSDGQYFSTNQSAGFSGTLQAKIAHTASAVNYHQLTGSATGSGPIHSVAGSDTNIDLNLTPKGTGQTKATNSTSSIMSSVGQSGYGSFLAQGSTGNAAYYFGYSGSSEVGRITMTGNTDFGTSSSALLQLRVANTASAVNYVQVTGGTTGSVNGTTISSQGSDADVNLRVVPKGAGYLYVRQDSTASTGILLQNRSSTGSPEMGIRFITGGFDLSDSRYAEISSTGGGSNTLIFKTGNGTSPQEFLRIAANGDMTLGGSNTAPNFKIVRNGSAINFLQVTGAATGFGPLLSAQGTDTNIPLVLQPKGTGALQAQQTDSTATGGNARGANAVDWQTLRDFAVKVASGVSSFLGGGQYNQASGGQSVTVGGNNVVTSGSKAVSVGGDTNTNAAQLAFLGGGYTQTLSSNGQFGFLGGGYANTLAGFYNVIGGGYTNSGTSGSAVTTQSSTMNGTTAVTLGASNASIKVGQLITGTFINSFPATYVAAISGTSLTLSQVASGSGTSTLSFFTPHGVVVGGGNNQATGSYSFIGGGGDAGTAANRNVASGDYSVVVGGRGNTASGVASFVGGGGYISGISFSNIAGGNSASVVGGLSNQASAQGSFVGGGYANVSNGTYSSIVGGARGTTRSIISNSVFSSNNPIADLNGASQAALLVLGVQTTDATATVLRSDVQAAGTTNQVILPNNSAYYFKGSVIANVTGAANGAAWSFEGAIMRGANAASTVLIDTPSVNRVAASSGASAWVVAVTADTTNGGLAVTVTGAASTTIRWVAKLETAEVTF